MKQLTSFMSFNIEGGERISYTYNVLDDGGEVVEQNVKKSFFALDQDLINHINAIKDYIRANKLAK